MVKKRNLPCFMSLLETGPEVQGQNPAHMILTSLPVRQACCSNLHCQRERHEHSSNIYEGDRRQKKKKKKKRLLIQTRRCASQKNKKKGSKNELSSSACLFMQGQN